MSVISNQRDGGDTRDGCVVHPTSAPKYCSTAFVTPMAMASWPAAIDACYQQGSGQVRTLVPGSDVGVNSLCSEQFSGEVPGRQEAGK